MTVSVSVITSPSDFSQIAPMVFDGWQQPYNPQRKHFRPPFASRNEAVTYTRDDAISEFRAQDPKMFMLKAVDTETGDIVGFAQWYVNDKPDPYGERTVASWYAEGSEEKEFAERFINGLWAFIGKRVSRPHMDLHSIVVHLDHRKRGIGRLLTRWGLDKADELGIETVVGIPEVRNACETYTDFAFRSARFLQRGARTRSVGWDVLR
jgi:GNAT superfamily N-acetyltransferase